MKVRCTVLHFIPHGRVHDKGRHRPTNSRPAAHFNTTYNVCLYDLSRGTTSWQKQNPGQCGKETDSQKHGRRVMLLEVSVVEFPQFVLGGLEPRPSSFR